MNKKKFENILIIIGFVIALFYAIQSIHEIKTRDDFLNYLNQEITTKENLLKDKTLVSDSTYKHRLSEEISFLYLKLKDVEGLMNLGAGYKNIIVGELRYDIDEYFNNNPKQKKYVNPPLSFFYSFILGASNEILIFILILVCGALGAIINSFINNIQLKVVRIILGISAAIISFIGIKSGEFIFIESLKDGFTRLNPYTISFLALLAGIYSEKIFKYLGEKVKIKSTNGG